MLNKIYKILFDEYGPQGWWPVISNTEFTKTNGYHKENYNIPEPSIEKYEIILGSILTQNTTWLNASKSLLNIHSKNLINPEKILKLTNEELSEIIKSSGYHNQKAKKIKYITDFLLVNNYLEKNRIPNRKELLSIWGIGPETADSILLYAYKGKSFVVDTYTQRIFSRIGIINKKNSYDKIKHIFESSIPKNLIVYNEYHALIVEHAKEHCRKKPKCENCCLNKICKKII